MSRLDEILRQIEWAGAYQDLNELEVEDCDQDILDMIDRIDKEVQQELKDVRVKGKSTIK